MRWIVKAVGALTSPGQYLDWRMFLMYLLLMGLPYLWLVMADVFQFNVLHDVKLAVALPRGTESGWPCRILQECDSVEVFQMNV